MIAAKRMSQKPLQTLCRWSHLSQLQWWKFSSQAQGSEKMGTESKTWAVDQLLAIFDARGSDSYFGDAVTKKEHSLQAATIAQERGECDEMIAACLLHDIGHLIENDDMQGYGVCDHGKIGEKYLVSHLNIKSKKVAQLVGQHINAKRYLVYKDGDSYYNTLSHASKQTLQYQGGAMTTEQATQFEKEFDNEMIQEIVRLRHYDDLAKVKDQKTPSLHHFVPLLEKYF